MALKDRELRLIVGVDYGTTYSGLSFALSNAADFKDIISWTKYPGAFSHSAEHCVKAPSRIAFKEENEDLGKDFWGYQVEPGMTSCSMTKLLLDKFALLSDFDDPDVYGSNSAALMHVTEGKSIKYVTTEYLKLLYQMFETSKREKFGSMDLDKLAVEFWLTVPASWSEKAKMITKVAAIEAGFGSRPIDTIKLIPEPEAAAHYILKSSIDRLDTVVQAGDGIMICDCGGGTVDITTYGIKALQPGLKLDEIAVGVAGKCGATMVDRNFFKLMSDRFGNSFTSSEQDAIGPGSAFMNQFEQRKKDFSRANSNQRPYRLSLHIPNLKRSRKTEKYYERRSSSVLLSHDDLRLVFDPVVKKVLALIANQARQAEEIGETPISTVAVVGGFADSRYLCEAIEEWCLEKGIRFTKPVTGAWCAISKGAVLRGLEGSIVGEKKCRRHYGSGISRVYNPDKHNGYDESIRWVWLDVFDNEKYLTGFMDWQVCKGERLTQNSEFESDFITQVSRSPPIKAFLELYSCNLHSPPENVEDSRVELVGEVFYELHERHLAKARRRLKDGKLYYEVSLVIKTRLNDDSGHLVYRVFDGDEELGKAEIKLDD